MCQTILARTCFEKPNLFGRLLLSISVHQMITSGHFPAPSKNTKFTPKPTSFRRKSNSLKSFQNLLHDGWHSNMHLDSLFLGTCYLFLQTHHHNALHKRHSRTHDKKNCGQTKKFALGHANAQQMANAPSQRLSLSVCLSLSLSWCVLYIIYVCMCVHLCVCVQPPSLTLSSPAREKIACVNQTRAYVPTNAAHEHISMPTQMACAKCNLSPKRKNCENAARLQY
jgi:hypothetical protein